MNHDQSDSLGIRLFELHTAVLMLVSSAHRLEINWQFVIYTRRQ